MKISSRLAISIHTLLAIKSFHEKYKITSDFLASSINVNPVIIRRIISQLNNAGITEIISPKSGISIRRPLENISVYDLYVAVDCIDQQLFNFHTNPNISCPVGKNIHEVLDGHFNKIQYAFESMLKDIKISTLTNELNDILKF